MPVPQPTKSEDKTAAGQLRLARLTLWFKVVGAILTGVFAIVVFFAAVLPLVNDVTDESEDGPARSGFGLKANGAAGPPREFLYLDGARTDAYLSQFDGGSAGAETLTSAESSKAAAEAGIGAASVSGERQRSTGRQQVLTPTNFSRFYRLVSLLDDEQNRFRTKFVSAPVPPQGGQVAPTSFSFVTQSLRKVREGDFVRLTTRVTMPSFAQLYQALDPANAGPASTKDGQAVRKAIGTNPRFPFYVRIGATDGQKLTIVMPAQFAAVAAPIDLFAGNVNVIGKVVYRVTPGRPYRDDVLANRFQAATTAPAALLKQLGLPSAKEIGAELSEFRAVKDPALVILPIAIFK